HGDPASDRLGPARGASPSLPRLLDQGTPQDGLQAQVPALGTVRWPRLAAAAARRSGMSAHLRAAPWPKPPAWARSRARAGSRARAALPAMLALAACVLLAGCVRVNIHGDPEQAMPRPQTLRIAS